MSRLTLQFMNLILIITTLIGCTDTENKNNDKKSQALDAQIEITKKVIESDSSSNSSKDNVTVKTESEFTVFGMKIGVDRNQTYIKSEPHDPEYRTFELDGLKTYQVTGKDIEPFTSVPKKGYITALVGPKSNIVIGYVMYRVYDSSNGFSFINEQRDEFLKIDRGLELKYKLISSENNPGDTVLGASAVGISKRYLTENTIIEITSRT